MSGRASSSSDEESNFHSTFNVPTVNLAHLRKKESKSNAKTNLAKAKKKFAHGKKSVRFPDSTDARNYRDSMMSSSSTPNFSPDRSEEDSGSGEDIDRSSSTGSKANLPNFKFEPSREAAQSESEDSEGSVAPQLSHSIDAYNDESSDEETSHQERDPNPEVDIADIRKSRSSSSSKDGSKRNEFRDIFKRASLAEVASGSDMSAPSKSDTFLGRVINFAGGHSLGGGGLTPGANSSKEETLDEEKNVGFGKDEPIEMKNLNFASLGKEAQDLIYSHVPDLRDKVKYSDSDADTKRDSANYSQGDLGSRDNTEPNSSDEMIQGQSKTFYEPNPNLFKEDVESDLHDEDPFETEDYIAPPKQVHAGVLSSLLKLYQNGQENKSTSTFGTSNSHLFDDQSDYEDLNGHPHHEFSHLKSKMKSGQKRIKGKFLKGKSPTPERYELDDDDTDGKLEGEGANLPSFQNARPKMPKGESKKMGKKFKKRDKKLRITVHIADILQRQRFIIRMCKALMLYGAPTHRLEEYMIMTSRVLEIDGQFVYFPGTMIVAFGDAATRTSEVHLVRCAQGLNLSKLADTHKIYKDVIHDLVGVEEAGTKLEELLKRKNQYPPWICVLLFGLGAGSVCTWSFDGGWYDVPITFGIGLIIGYLQFFLSPKSHLYSSVFEVTASIVVSFISRAIGSIQNGKHFCFGAIAQGSLALILPGYVILCGSLELQSKNLVAGSVRMFYAIIYSLFLGFGITLGAALYGWVDHDATDAAQCATGHSIDDKWRILLVPLFSVCLGLINQARFRQLPVMTLITAISYVGTYFAGKHFSNVTEFTAAIGAFIIGILGNMYSRVGKGMAVSAMLPAIFVQVPSGIASKSTLLAGVTTANEITNSSSDSSDSSDLSSLSFGATMVEVSIGISVGLFAAALVVYPFGKKRTGLFSL